MTQISIDASLPLPPASPPKSERADRDAFADRLAEAGKSASKASDNGPRAADSKPADRPQDAPAEAVEQDESASGVEQQDSEHQDDAAAEQGDSSESAEAVVVADQAAPQQQDVVEISAEIAAATNEEASGEATEEGAEEASGDAPDDAESEPTEATVETPSGEELEVAPAEEASAEDNQTNTTAAGDDQAADDEPQLDEHAAAEAVQDDGDSPEKVSDTFLEPTEADAAADGETLESADDATQPAAQQAAAEPQTGDKRSRVTAREARLQRGEQPAAEAGQAGPTEPVVKQPTDGAAAIAAVVDAAAQDAPVEVEASAESKPEPAAPTQSPHSSLERLTSSRLGGGRTAEASTSSGQPQVDPARFISRVSKAFDAASQRGGEVRLRLSPPELGAMQIKLSVTPEGTMNASVETETAAARTVLLDNLPALRERLASMEIRVEQFDVDLQQDGASQQDWSGAEEQRDQQRAERQNTPAGAAPTAAEAPAAETTPTGGVTPGSDQINLVA